MSVIKEGHLLLHSLSQELAGTELLSFFRPIVSPKSLVALAKWLVIFCKSSSNWVTNAQSPANCSSCTVMSLTFLFAVNLARLRSLPSVLMCRKTPAFSTEVASRRTATKNSPNRVGAKTQPCFTPLLMGNWSDSSPHMLMLSSMPY